MYAQDAAKLKQKYTQSFLMSDSNAEFNLSHLNESLHTLIDNDPNEEKLLDCDETDMKCLKNNILFKYTNPEKIYTLIREKTIMLKRKKLNEIIAKGFECQDNIYIVKSGEIRVLIKLTRDNLRTYTDKIDKYHVKNEADYLHISKQKARYRRSALIDLIARKNSLDSDRPSYINCGSQSDLASSRYTSCSSINSSTQNLNSHRSGLVSSRVATAGTVRSRVMTAKSKRPETGRTESNGYGGVVTGQQRPVTTRYTRNGESGSMAFRGTLARFTGFTKQPASDDTSNLSLNSENVERGSEASDRFEKKFESSLKTIMRANSAQTDTGTEKSVKTAAETGTEFSEDTQNDFELLESPSQLLASRPKTGGTSRKQLRIADDAQQDYVNVASTTSIASCGQKACYIKLMQVRANEMFGLSELIFNNNKNIYKENFTIENFRRGIGFNMSDFESDQNLNMRNLNSYVMICNSREVEYYVVNKSTFLNNMNDTEKFFFQSQIENMQKNCPQIPTNEVVSGNFAEKQKWNTYKKKVYTEALKSRSSAKFSNSADTSFRTKSAHAISSHRPANLHHNLPSDPTASLAPPKYHSQYSTSDLIRNARMNVKNANQSVLSQNFTFNLSKEIMAQKRNSAQEHVHAGKIRFRF